MQVNKNIIRIMITGSDISENHSFGKNQFNGNVLYNCEKYKVQDALDYLNREWSDIIDYQYTPGLRLPAHMETNLTKRKSTSIDGYEILIMLKGYSSKTTEDE